MCVYVVLCAFVFFYVFVWIYVCTYVCVPFPQLQYSFFRYIIFPVQYLIKPASFSEVTKLIGVYVSTKGRSMCNSWPYSNSYVSFLLSHSILPWCFYVLYIKPWVNWMPTPPIHLCYSFSRWHSHLSSSNSGKALESAFNSCYRLSCWLLAWVWVVSQPQCLYFCFKITDKQQDI